MKGGMSSVLLLGFGFAVIGNAINSFAWGKLLIDRLNVKDRPNWFFDIYCTVRFGLTILSISLFVAYIIRLYELLTGTLATLPPLIVFTVYTLSIAEAFFIRCTWIAGQKTPSYLWLFSCIAWTVFVVERIA